MTPQPSRARSLGQTLTAVADQTAFSIGNALVVLLAVHGQGLRLAGVVTLVQTGYVLATTVCQGASLEGTVIRGRLETLDDRSAAFGLALLVGTAQAAYAAVVLAATGFASPAAWLVVLVCPALTAQYVGRGFAIARGRSGIALVSDVAWLMVQVGAWLLIRGHTPLASLLAWAIGGAVASWIVVPAATYVRFVATRDAWQRLSREGRYAAELLIGQGVTQLNYVTATSSPVQL